MSTLSQVSSSSLSSGTMGAVTTETEKSGTSTSSNFSEIIFPSSFDLESVFTRAMVPFSGKWRTWLQEKQYSVPFEDSRFVCTATEEEQMYCNEFARAIAEPFAKQKKERDSVIADVFNKIVQELLFTKSEYGTPFLLLVKKHKETVLKELLFHGSENLTQAYIDTKNEQEYTQYLCSRY